MFQRNAWASITALCVCSLALCISQASAQEKVLKQYYGNGVHAYYSGNYAEAYDLLSKPINAKIEDPRPYYFRGFALMELGRPDQAEKDFKDGAALELKDTTGRFPVNFALESFRSGYRRQLRLRSDCLRWRHRDHGLRQRRLWQLRDDQSRKRLLFALRPSFRLRGFGGRGCGPGSGHRIRGRHGLGYRTPSAF